MQRRHLVVANKEQNRGLLYSRVLLVVYHIRLEDPKVGHCVHLLYNNENYVDTYVLH